MTEIKANISKRIVTGVTLDNFEIEISYKNRLRNRCIDCGYHWKCICANIVEWCSVCKKQFNGCTCTHVCCCDVPKCLNCGHEKYNEPDESKEFLYSCKYYSCPECGEQCSGYCKEYCANDCGYSCHNERQRYGKVRINFVTECCEIMDIDATEEELQDDLVGKKITDVTYNEEYDSEEGLSKMQEWHGDLGDKTSINGYELDIHIGQLHYSYDVYCASNGCHSGGIEIDW